MADKKEEVKEETKKEAGWLTYAEKEEKEKEGYLMTEIKVIDGEKKYKLEKPSK